MIFKLKNMNLNVKVSKKYLFHKMEDIQVYQEHIRIIKLLFMINQNNKLFISIRIKKLLMIVNLFMIAKNNIIYFIQQMKRILVL